MMVQACKIAIATPNVAVILVNYYGWRDTLECLDSLLHLHAPGKLHVLITDNASTDESVEKIIAWMSMQGQVRMLKSGEQPDITVKRAANIYVTDADAKVTITLICNKTNDGFAAGNNLAMALALTLFEPNYFWILNNDTLVQKDTLVHMLARMAVDSGLGICGASLLFYHRPDVVQAYGGVRYSFWTGRGWHLGAGQCFSSATDPQPLEAVMTYVSGASMLVSRAFYDDVGPMNEEYFLYNEELDWVWRARGHFRLAVAPKAVVIHKEGASIGTVSEENLASLIAEFYQARNKLKFTIRNLPWCFPTVWIFMAAKAVRMLLRNQRGNANVIFSALVGRQQPATGWSTKRRGCNES